MFVDASAMVALIEDEPEGRKFARALLRSERSITSSIAIWETVVSLARTSKRPFASAEALVGELLATFRIRTIPITPEIGALAIDASRRFGRGRHPASLNVGDCFAYTCAKAHDVPLLYKDEDFPQTDIEAA